MTNITIKFNQWSRDKLKKRIKWCTSRGSAYGKEGDTFEEVGVWWRLLSVARLPLWFVAKFLFNLEGAKSRDDFVRVWKSIHRGKYGGAKWVYTHFFEEA